MRRPRPHPELPGVWCVPLTQGKTTLVDADDLDKVGNYQWSALKGRHTFYAFRQTRIDGKQKSVRLHRLIVRGAPEVDHKDGDGLNNRRHNLRAATRANNAANVGRYRTNTSGIKGVSFCEARGKWLAQISVDGKRINLGRYDSKDEAATVYAQAEREYKGEFAPGPVERFSTRPRKLLSS